MKKYLKIILSIFLLCLILGGGWFWYASKKQSLQEKVAAEEVVQKNEASINQEDAITVVKQNLDTSTWKTYRNEDIGIEFKYPDDKKNWEFTGYDYSENNSLPYWPRKGIIISSKESTLNKIELTFAASRYSEGSVYSENTENSYVFNFNGQKAVGSLRDKNKLDSLLSTQLACDQTIGFELPNLPRISVKKEPVTLYFSCYQSLGENNLSTFQSILSSIHFFSPLK
jgi:hypothetical protein